MSQLLLTIYDNAGTPFEVRPAKAKQLILAGWHATPPAKAIPTPTAVPKPTPSIGVVRSEPTEPAEAATPSK
jgi:hypothetical protein